jgi:hypothetical protein
MTPRRYELTDFEWSIIEPLLPNKPRGVPRADDRRVLNGIYWQAADGVAMGRHPRAVWSSHDLLQPLRPLAEGGCLGQGLRGCLASL